MTTQIRALVAYATKHGATAQIAVEIGRVLRQAGLAADVLPVESITDLDPYQAVILGSAIYIGQWRKAAAAFLERHEAQLAERAVWLFSSGPTGQGSPADLLQAWRLPETLRPLAARIKPSDIAVFHGALDMEQLNIAEKVMVRGVKAPVGDFRDWAAIAAWAESIARALLRPEPAAALAAPMP